MSNPHLHTFAIGDVHGRADLLQTMLSYLETAASAEGFDYRIAFLGDIIDRGPRSRQAMDLVMQTVSNVSGSCLILGNHEASLLAAFDEPDQKRAEIRLLNWLMKQGGDATALSYGFDLGTLTLKSFRDGFDASHLAFLRQGLPYVELENHILVHAGLKPDVPLSQQDPHDLMWIRDTFLQHQGSFGKIVIHGHSPTASGLPELYSNRLALDTKAYASGNLTAAHIVGADIKELIWTTPHPPHSVEVVASVVEIVTGASKTAHAFDKVGR